MKTFDEVMAICRRVAEEVSHVPFDRRLDAAEERRATHVTEEEARAFAQDLQLPRVAEEERYLTVLADFAIMPVMPPWVEALDRAGLIDWRRDG